MLLRWEYYWEWFIPKSPTMRVSELKRFAAHIASTRPCDWDSAFVGLVLMPKRVVELWMFRHNEARVAGLEISLVEGIN